MKPIDQLRVIGENIARNSGSLGEIIGAVHARHKVALSALRLAEFHFRAYADHHAAKGDTEKQAANAKLADQMLDAIQAIGG